METKSAKFYVVEEGDTLTAIARRFGVTIKQLQLWNHIPDVNRIRVGQRLIVSKDEPDYVPFPGASWFRKANSPVVSVMGHRLMEEGCSAYTEDPPPYWTAEHTESYATWQRKLGYRGADADGTPGVTSWNKLRVPYPEDYGHTAA
ncbi:MAG TPA: peptidoglycan-binding protein [Streptomyces sp.]|uniref:LysM peptidoglycan-binding domain-containing protein n=1 Tax=Streptomyces sp. TaxID=1931 RepID=UPI002D6B5A42|nr:peptidoglycan-binding protein [Streptomyces sp.]HZG04679.1 peptidoglycan-binding protein [Streptomyces sp.]